MTSNPSAGDNSEKPVFRTPQPNELQSKQSQDAVRQRLVEEQETAADGSDNPPAQPDPKPADAANLLEDLDALSDRHPPSMDSPPG